MSESQPNPEQHFLNIIEKFEQLRNKIEADIKIASARHQEVLDKIERLAAKRLPEKEDFTKWNNPLALASIVLAISVFCVLFPSYWLPFFCIVPTIIYLSGILLSISLRVDGKGRRIKRHFPIPSCKNALIIFFCFLIAQILGFSSLFILEGSAVAPEINNVFSSIYASTLTICTLSAPQVLNSDGLLEFFIIAEIFCGILLFFGAFTVLISRISTF